jgi:hypothetical protein
MKTEELIYRLEEQEKRVKKRTIIFTLIPIITAIILITVTSREIIRMNDHLGAVEIKLEENEELHRDLKVQNDSLILVNDSLHETLRESTISLGRVSSVLLEFKEFIDRMNPADRPRDQAGYIIRFRMLEERVRGDYMQMAENLAKLPMIQDENDWIVIVKSSVSLEDLKMEASEVISIYGREQIAIYKEGETYFRLVVKGNGTFTRAYRLNVELINEHGFYGAYFDGRKDWGEDFLMES